MKKTRNVLSVLMICMTSTLAISLACDASRIKLDAAATLVGVDDYALLNGGAGGQTGAYQSYKTAKVANTYSDMNVATDNLEEAVKYSGAKITLDGSCLYNLGDVDLTTKSGTDENALIGVVPATKYIGPAKVANVNNPYTGLYYTFTSKINPEKSFTIAIAESPYQKSTVVGIGVDGSNKYYAGGSGDDGQSDAGVYTYDNIMNISRKGMQAYRFDGSYPDNTEDGKSTLDSGAYKRQYAHNGNTYTSDYANTAWANSNLGYLYSIKVYYDYATSRFYIDSTKWGHKHAENKKRAITYTKDSKTYNRYLLDDPTLSLETVKNKYVGRSEPWVPFTQEEASSVNVTMEVKWNQDFTGTSTEILMTDFNSQALNATNSTTAMSFEQKELKFTASLYSAGKEYKTINNITAGTKFSELEFENPSQAGYTFKGWSIDSDYQINSDIKANAIYELNLADKKMQYVENYALSNSYGDGKYTTSTRTTGDNALGTNSYDEALKASGALITLSGDDSINLGVIDITNSSGKDDNPLVGVLPALTYKGPKDDLDVTNPFLGLYYEFSSVDNPTKKFTFGIMEGNNDYKDTVIGISTDGSEAYYAFGTYPDGHESAGNWAYRDVTLEDKSENGLLGFGYQIFRLDGSYSPEGRYGNTAKRFYSHNGEVLQHSNSWKYYDQDWFYPIELFYDYKTNCFYTTTTRAAANTHTQITNRAIKNKEETLYRYLLDDPTQSVDKTSREVWTPFTDDEAKNIQVTLKVVWNPSYTGTAQILMTSFNGNALSSSVSKYIVPSSSLIQSGTNVGLVKPVKFDFVNGNSDVDYANFACDIISPSGNETKGVSESFTFNEIGEYKVKYYVNSELIGETSFTSALNVNSSLDSIDRIEMPSDLHSGSKLTLSDIHIFGTTSGKYDLNEATIKIYKGTELVSSSLANESWNSDLLTSGNYTINVSNSDLEVVTSFSVAKAIYSESSFENGSVSVNESGSHALVALGENTIELSPATGYKVSTFTVDGQNKLSSLENNVYVLNVTSTESDIKYAVSFEKITFDVIYKIDGNVAKTINGVEYGTVFSSLDAPSIPSKTDYQIVGWSISADSVLTQEVTANAIYRYKVVYSITFNTDGGSTIEDKEYSALDDVTEFDEVTTKEGYDFVGWYNGETKFEFGQKLTENITLTAKWKIKEFTVKYIVDGNTISEVKAHYGTKFNELSAPSTPNKDGFTFAGWSINPESEIKEDVSAIAKYELTEYTITFDCDGGTPIDSKKYTSIESVEEFDSKTTKVGYEFAGWYDGANKFVFGNTLSGNITLKAHWNVLTYTVVVKSDMFDDLTLSVEYGGKLELSQIEKSGYTLTLFKDKDYTTAYVDETISGNITIYALYVKSGKKDDKPFGCKGEAATAIIGLVGLAFALTLKKRK